MTDRTEAGLFRFDNFEIDISSGELRAAGVCIALQPQPFKVLTWLVARAGEILTREEIRRQLWNEQTFVDFKSGLNFCIRQIRKALGEDAKTPRYIETLHRRGYRFIAQVSRAEDQSSREKSPPDTVLQAVNVSRPVSVAVLPFHYAGNSATACHLADGIAELLITYLATNKSLRVTSKTSTAQYKHSEKSIPVIAEELRIDRVLEGSVLCSGSRVRVTARLINTSTDQLEWAGCYKGQMQDCIEFQNHIVSAIIHDTANYMERHHIGRQMQAHLGAAESSDAYLKGRYYLNERTEKCLNKAIEYFDRAIDDAPESAPAYAGLAGAYAVLCYSGPLKPLEMYARAKAAAQRALQLDFTLADAHATLAYCSMFCEWDWAAAENGFRKAIELDPYSVHAHQWYADFLTAVKRHDEAIEHIQLARRLDPLSLQLNTDVAWILLHANLYDRAIEKYREVLEMDSGFGLAHWGLGLAYSQIGMYPEAIDSLETAIGTTERTPSMLAALGCVLATSGRKRDALKVLAELSELATRRYISAYDMAAIAWALGDLTKTISCLEMACNERSPHIVYLEVDSRFKKLCSMQAADGVMRRVGFARA